MEDISKTRLASLKLICEQKGWGPSDLSRRVGRGNPSYWNVLLKGKKGFGEKAARNLEEALGLASGHLDAIGFIPSNNGKISRHAQEIAAAYDALPDDPKKEYLREIILRILGNA